MPEGSTNDEEMAPDDPNRMYVDYLLLADGAQVQGGKLYVLGGGWDRLQFPSYPSTLPIGLAFGVRVPWNETNRKHSFVIRGVSADANDELFRAEGEFEVGRPPGVPRGMSQFFQMAATLPLNIPKPGSYAVDAEIDGGKARRHLPFFAVEVPGLASQAQS
jgi:hypothetical protein